MNNVGLFKGRNVIDLKIDRGKNLILFGGNNGSGKTTLLDSIKLCLYGSKVFGEKPKSKEYLRILSDKIHRSKIENTQSSGASIGLMFEQENTHGKTSIFIERKWEMVNGTIIEDAKLQRNGVSEKSSSREETQDLINEIFPWGLCKFYIFDGEKVQALAESDSLIFEADSIKEIMGLNVIEKLSKDLILLKGRMTNDKGAQLIHEYAQLEKGKIGFEEEIKVLRQEIASKEGKIRQLTGMVEKIEVKISAEGGSFLDRVNSLKDNLNKTKTDKMIAEEKIRDLFTDLLPFAFSLRRLKVLEARLKEEIKQREKVNAASFLYENKDEFISRIFETINWDQYNFSSPTMRENLINTLTDSIGSKLREIKASEERFIHSLEHTDGKANLTWIEKVDNEIYSRLKQLTHRLSEYWEEELVLTQSLQRVPSEDVIKPLVDNMKNITVEIGKLREEKRNLEQNLSKANHKLDQVINKMKFLGLEIGKSDASEKRIGYLNKTLLVLDEYYEKTLSSKIKNFNDALFDNFNKLYRKKERISKIELCPETFDAMFYDASNQRLDKKELSAGEKQIYAVAFLWALSNVSGKKFPIIIDTPLGRLDSRHRENIISEYLLKAGEQVVIFSTDTEFDKKNYDQVREYVAQSYHLKYDDKNHLTNVLKGYFWDHEEMTRNVS